ncbi:hypothetical protein HYALB_00008291 [Hymenoscyphus albidus]|uniref:Zn(2)-C6 fungal-type domain-containing protein n=1 Tax=Hymenoscyphus albidus TaxID=595503 RepID=A0A9N9LI73_9HELO|nr:hypothetical protein HYALB_00008291 [Hymenoscyphus albidus]
MASRLRSKQGCWTCRLRKKKCDERHPICSTCESLTITCHGYDSKPDWMDGGENERAMANSIKQTIKQTSRSRASGKIGSLTSRFQRHIIQQTQSIRPALAPRAVVDFEGQPSPASSIGPGSHQDTDTMSNVEGFKVREGSSENEVKARDPRIQRVPLSTVSADESILLMHFLDVVFYIQYPMYKSSVHEGGRGWLLSLLLHTRPLYHAALALSAYHRGTILLASRRNANHADVLVEQEKHLAACLSNFQRHIKHVHQFVEDRNPGECLGVLACVVQLIFFEIFINQSDSWQVHLRAATGFVSEAYSDNLHLGTAQNPLAMDVYSKPPLQPCHDVPTPQEVVIFRFFGGVVFWLDVVSCITTGKSPQILALSTTEPPSSAFNELQAIMGCKNWVMFQIGHIASIHARRTAAFMTDYSESDEEMRLEAGSILAKLELGTTELGAMSCGTLNGTDQTNEQLLSPYCTAITTTIQITRLFSFMGLIYLKWVLIGFHPESECMTYITNAMDALKHDTPRHILPAVISPLYVIGCAAREEDKPFFRDVLSSAPLIDPSLVHRGKILPLLEKIWILRDNSPNGVSWSEILQQSDGSLLLF